MTTFFICDCILDYFFKDCSVAYILGKKTWTTGSAYPSGAPSMVGFMLLSLNFSVLCSVYYCLSVYLSLCILGLFLIMTFSVYCRYMSLNVSLVSYPPFFWTMHILTRLSIIVWWRAIRNLLLTKQFLREGNVNVILPFDAP